MPYKPTYITDPNQIAEALAKVGFEMDAKVRPDTNDKLQFRLRADDHSTSVSVSFVPADAEAVAERAHWHVGQDEHYFILEGMIVLAIEGPGDIDWRKLGPGDSMLVPRGVVHNSYVFPGTRSLVTKRGTPVPDPDNTKGADWWFDEDFTECTQSISPEQALNRSR
jgi:mannose-6-phosphate isomerase-like protein (cupin superfamily)